MAGTYSDQEISVLIQERKALPRDWRSRSQLRPKRGHEERDLELVGGAGSEFHVILRKNTINALDFSIIVAVRVPNSNTLFRLASLQRQESRAHQPHRGRHFLQLSYPHGH